MIRTRIDLLRAEKSHREERKITYRVIEEETGLAITTVNRLATGKTARAEFGTLSTLCKYFEVSIGELLEYVPDQEGKS